jgi:hypothetical protein
MRIFDAGEDVKPYVDIHRTFKRTEKIALCREALADGSMTTKELSLFLMRKKGLDAGDKVLLKGELKRRGVYLCAACRKAGGDRREGDRPKSKQ